jgi:hypothetical protein
MPGDRLKGLWVGLSGSTVKLLALVAKAGFATMLGGPLAGAAQLGAAGVDAYASARLKRAGVSTSALLKTVTGGMTTWANGEHLTVAMDPGLRVAVDLLARYGLRFDEMANLNLDAAAVAEEVLRRGKGWLAGSPTLTRPSQRERCGRCARCSSTTRSCARRSTGRRRAPAWRAARRPSPESSGS